MSGGLPTDVATVIAMAETIRSGDVSAMGLTGELVRAIERLPPTLGEGITRPVQQRGTSRYYTQDFENVAPSPATETKNIVLEEAGWIRAIVSTCIIQAVNVQTAAAVAAVAREYGLQGRAFFDLKFRLNERQGFVYGPRVETFGEAVIITGTAEFPSPMDWTLQKEDGIQLTIRNRLSAIYPEADPALTMRWVTVTFFVEPLEKQPYGF